MNNMNIKRANKLIKSCGGDSFLTKMFQDPLGKRLRDLCEILKDIVANYKKIDDVTNQVKYMLLFDEYCDRYYKNTNSKIFQIFQIANMKELLHLHHMRRYDLSNVIEYIHKFIYMSEDTHLDSQCIHCYEYIIRLFHSYVFSDFDLMEDIYNKMKGIRGVYEEGYGDLLITKRNSFRRAGEIYEEIAKFKIECKLTNFIIEDLLFKSLLCYMCHDIVYVDAKIKEFNDNYAIVGTSGKIIFIKELLQLYANAQRYEIISLVREYDMVYNFSSVVIILLSVIKKNIHSDIIIL